MLSSWQLVYQIYLPSIVTQMAKESQSRQPVLPWTRRTFFISSLNLYYPWSGSWSLVRQGQGWVRWPKRPTIYLLQVVQRGPKIENIMLLRFKISQTISINFSFHFLDFSVCDDTPFHYFLLLLHSMMINKQSGRASVAQKKRWGRAAQNNNCYWGQIWMNRTQKPSENMWHRIIRGKNYRLHF